MDSYLQINFMPEETEDQLLYNATPTIRGPGCSLSHVGSLGALLHVLPRSSTGIPLLGLEAAYVVAHFWGISNNIKK